MSNPNPNPYTSAMYRAEYPGVQDGSVCPSCEEEDSIHASRRRPRRTHRHQPRRRAHGETCSVCWPCGTTRARIRHRERRERCEQCSTPKTKRQPKPCGTYAAYVRHRNHGEQPCEACVAAMREYSLRSYRRSMARAKESAQQVNLEEAS